MQSYYDVAIVTLLTCLGLVWIIGRIIYFVGYVASPSRRFPGFFIQAMAVFALLLGALGRIIYLAATDGLS